jgi:hypothetical protein
MTQASPQEPKYLICEACGRLFIPSFRHPQFYKKSINRKRIGISLKQGDNTINAACNAEFELSEDIKIKDYQSLPQWSTKLCQLIQLQEIPFDICIPDSQ